MTIDAPDARPASKRAPLVLRALLVLASALAWLQPARAQTPVPPTLPFAAKAQTVLRIMSPNARVGQLFVISYLGSDGAVLGDLNELLVNYRVGGVQLRAANQNFANAPDVTRQVADLANRLQSVAAAQTFGEIPALLQVASSPTATQRLQETVPLFVVLSQEGDGWPNSELTQGVTTLPSQLSIGATWKPERAETLGYILGAELERAGINTLLGPVLDVLEAPRPGQPGDSGTRVFGGDPFWVGQFGAAFAAGVHAGSSNRMAVIAKNFPGLGGADRNVEDEIPTVQKSLEQLRSFDLAPFFALMQFDPRADSKVNASRADGLLMTHIRYRGFQGNIRANTRPVSLDPQAYDALLKLPEIAPWRAAGGVMFSDALGLRSVRRYDDPNEKTFNARKVAQDAFVAGNDVLMLGNFAIRESWPEQLANIKDTIVFFREQYAKDAQFAARVDAAVLRILSLKLRLYGGNPLLGSVLVNADRAAQALKVDEPTARRFADALNSTAKDGITLLSPSPRELPVLLPQPPGKDDNLVFLMDDRRLQECPRCATYSAVGKTALQDIALKLYGPSTTGQLNPNKVNSFTFAELADGLRITGSTLLTETAEPGSLTISETITVSRAIALRVRPAIEAATWIVIGMIDLKPSERAARTLKEFLAQRGDTLREKKVIVFTLGPPYYLDATEISKITAYYGVYSRTPASLEAAVRVLFGEFVPGGSSPVTVGALNYVLSQQTAPNPTQIIPLANTLIPQLPAGVQATVTPPVRPTLAVTATAAVPQPKIGDKIRLSAGPVLDRNNRMVPDGTPVQFVLSFQTERLEQTLPAVSTRNGMAETTVTLERKGRLEFRAESNEAHISERVQVTIDDNNVGNIETIRPTVVPPSPLPQPSPTFATRPTDVPASTPVPTPPPPEPIRANFSSFVATLIMQATMALLAMAMLSGSRRVQLSERWRAVLWSWIGGWLAYALVAVGVPGTNSITKSRTWGGAVVVALGAALAIMIAAILRRLVIAEQHQP